MAKKKILYISGGRMDYGLMKETLLTIQKNSYLELKIVATGLHLMPKFGKTIQQILKDGFLPIVARATFQQDNKPSMALFLAQCVKELTKIVAKEKPDFILLLGDRAEMLAGAIVGAYLSIPVCHIHGGDVSSTVDESARHSITKLAHLHFPATQKSAQRILKMGEEKWRIFLTGSPAIDAILKEKLLSKKEFCQKMDLDEKREFCLVIQHPVTLEAEKAGWQMEQTLGAVAELSMQTIVIYPNSDAGANQIIAVIEKYAKKYPLIKPFKNLERTLFLSALKNADVMLGNSSSGIIDSPSFHLPAINIGARERDREQSANVINVEHNKIQIKQTIIKAQNDKNFREKVKSCQSPYGNGKTGEKIAKILSEIKINKKLLDKKLTY